MATRNGDNDPMETGMPLPHEHAPDRDALIRKIQGCKTVNDVQPFIAQMQKKRYHRSSNIVISAFIIIIAQKDQPSYSNAAGILINAKVPQKLLDIAKYELPNCEKLVAKNAPPDVGDLCRHFLDPVTIMETVLDLFEFENPHPKPSVFDNLILFYGDVTQEYSDTIAGYMMAHRNVLSINDGTNRQPHFERLWKLVTRVFSSPKSIGDCFISHPKVIKAITQTFCFCAKYHVHPSPPDGIQPGWFDRWAQMFACIADPPANHWTIYQSVASSLPPPLGPRMNSPDILVRAVLKGLEYATDKFTGYSGKVYKNSWAAPAEAYYLTKDVLTDAEAMDWYVHATQRIMGVGKLGSPTATESSFLATITLRAGFLNCQTLIVLCRCAIMLYPIAFPHPHRHPSRSGTTGQSGKSKVDPSDGRTDGTYSITEFSKQRAAQSFLRRIFGTIYSLLRLSSNPIWFQQALTTPKLSPPCQKYSDENLDNDPDSYPNDLISLILGFLTHFEATNIDKETGHNVLVMLTSQLWCQSIVLRTKAVRNSLGNQMIKEKIKKIESPSSEKLVKTWVKISEQRFGIVELMERLTGKGMVCAAKECVESRSLVNDLKAGRHQEGTLQVCSGCKGVHYSSSKCQKTDWPRHKSECVEVQRRWRFSFPTEVLLADLEFVYSIMVLHIRENLQEIRSLAKSNGYDPDHPTQRFVIHLSYDKGGSAFPISTINTGIDIVSLSPLNKFASWYKKATDGSTDRWRRNYGADPGAATMKEGGEKQLDDWLKERVQTAKKQNEDIICAKVFWGGTASELFTTSATGLFLEVDGNKPLSPENVGVADERSSSRPKDGHPPGVSLANRGYVLEQILKAREEKGQVVDEELKDNVSLARKNRVDTLFDNKAPQA